MIVNLGSRKESAHDDSRDAVVSFHDLLLLAGIHGDVKYLEDERLLEIRADLEERRRQYCEASGLNASSVLTAAHASDIVRVWCEKEIWVKERGHTASCRRACSTAVAHC